MQESNFHKKQYRIAPAGHMILGQQDVIKKAEEMRPYLSFSIPAGVGRGQGLPRRQDVRPGRLGAVWYHRQRPGWDIKVETSCSNNKKTRASASAGANAIRNRPPEWLGADLGGNASRWRAATTVPFEKYGPFSILHGLYGPSGGLGLFSLC